MAGPWHCQRDDYSIFVFHQDEHPGLVINGDGGHETELAAWEYGIDCMIARRDQINTGLKAARAEARRLKRPLSRKDPSQ